MKNFLRIVAMMLVAVIAISCPLNAFAASSATKYISEIKISYGKTLADAKKWLTNQGYQVVDADLNEEADSALVSARAVCIGYETTNNPDEAITDLKVMNMKGNYSFEAYEIILEQQAEEIGIFVSQLIASLEEYRENYKRGLYKAIAAHDLLEKILDDDTGKTMGGLLLNKTVQEMSDEEFSALSDEEKLNHADMVKILMQGNSQATLSIEQYLCIASDTADDSFVDRLAAFGCYDDFETDYARSKNIFDGTALEKALAADYDDLAISIASKIDTFKKLLDYYGESDLKDETNEDAVVAYFNENGKNGDYLSFNNARNLYLALSEIEYEGGTLCDFFTDDEYDFAEEDRYMLYPLASVLSDGQRACLRYVSLAQLFDNGIMNDDAWKANYNKIKADVIDKSPVVSAFAGINRDAFNGGVALTNKAKQLNESTTDNYMDNWVLDSVSTTTYLLLAGFAVNAIAGLGCKIAASVLKGQITKAVVENVKAWNYIEDVSGDVIAMKLKDLTAKEAKKATEMVLKGTLAESYEFSGDAYFVTNSSKVMAKKVNLINNIGNVFCILMIIFATVSAISAWNDLDNYYHTDKTPIPVCMVDESTDEDGKNTYTYYSAVTCNRKEAGFVDDKNKILGYYGDLNGDIGKEWLALYATKDKNAGNPIKAEFLCQKGKNTAGSNTPLTMFGDKNALNLVDEKYAFNDEFGGIYLFYSVGNAYTSSVLSSGKIAIIAVSAVALIAAGAFIIIKKEKGRRSINTHSSHKVVDGNNACI